MESSSKPRLRGQVRIVIEATVSHGVAGQDVGRRSEREGKGRGLLVLIPAGPERYLLNDSYMLTVVSHYLV